MHIAETELLVFVSATARQSARAANSRPGDTSLVQNGKSHGIDVESMDFPEHLDKALNFQHRSQVLETSQDEEISRAAGKLVSSELIPLRKMSLLR